SPSILHFLLPHSPPHPHPPSFPTRRSSDLPLPRARGASAVDPAHRRPRRPAGRRGRHRGVAAFGGSDGCEAPGPDRTAFPPARRSEEHTSELQSRFDLVCRLLLEKKKTNQI